MHFINTNILYLFDEKLIDDRSSMNQLWPPIGWPQRSNLGLPNT